MPRLLIVFTIFAICGAIAVWFIPATPHTTPSADTTPSPLLSELAAAATASAEALAAEQSRVATLSAELAALRAAQPPIAPQAFEAAPAALPALTPPLSAEDTAEIEHSTVAALASVTRALALSQTEQENLRAALRAGLTTGALPDEIFEQQLSPAQFERYQDQQLEFKRSIRQDVSEQEGYRFGRKLGLSSDQEQQLIAIIKDSRDEFFPIVRRAKEIDQPAKQSETERSRELLLKERARQQAVTERARALLTESQYNSFLELQANSSANQAHDSFVESAPTAQPTP